MSLREKINNNSAAATIIAVVVLVIALGIMVWANGGGSSGRDFQVFYYDLNSKTLYARPATTPAPYDLGNGTFTYFDGDSGAGVRALVFACEKDADISAGMSQAEVEAAGGKIIALQRFTPAASPATKNVCRRNA